MDPVRDADEQQVRLTEREALANVRTVLELCAAGKLRCSDKTSHPTAATIALPLMVLPTSTSSAASGTTASLWMTLRSRAMWAWC